MLNLSQKKEILGIIVSGKGVIPYEKINSIDSLNLKPEDSAFFLKDEFFSTLKGKAILKMSDLYDLNDLYNAQDVILFLEIMEYRFQAMNDMSLMYNPRKCNSATKLSSCIQQEQSKVALPTNNLALLTNNSIIKVFEKT